MKIKLKQWCSTIPPISTTRTTTLTSNHLTRPIPYFYPLNLSIGINVKWGKTVTISIYNLLLQFIDFMLSTPVSLYIFVFINISNVKTVRGRDRMIVGFTTTYAISVYHHWCEFESRSGRGVQHYVITFVSDLWQVDGFLRVLYQ